MCMYYTKGTKETVKNSIPKKDSVPRWLKDTVTKKLIALKSTR